MDFCQIDAARVGGVNENLAIILMAAKYKGKKYEIARDSSLFVTRSESSYRYSLSL